MTNNTQKTSIPLQVVSCLLILGELLSIAGLILSQQGASFFRWGTVGVGFYVVNFAVISIGLAGSLVLCGEPRLRLCQEALSLRGIASLAVVPLHYFLIYLVVIIGEKRVDLFRYGLIAISVLITSFLLARAVENFSPGVRQFKKQKLIWLGLVVMLLLAATITLIGSKETASIVILPKTFG